MPERPGSDGQWDLSGRQTDQRLTVCRPLDHTFDRSWEVAGGRPQRWAHGGRDGDDRGHGSV